MVRSGERGTIGLLEEVDGKALGEVGVTAPKHGLPGVGGEHTFAPRFPTGARKDLLALGAGQLIRGEDMSKLSSLDDDGTKFRLGSLELSGTGEAEGNETEPLQFLPTDVDVRPSQAPTLLAPKTCALDTKRAPTTGGLRPELRGDCDMGHGGMAEGLGLLRLAGLP